MIADMYAMRDALEDAISWTYVESEGVDVVRFDWYNRSIWVHNTGEIAGIETFHKPYQKQIKSIVQRFTKD